MLNLLCFLGLHNKDLVIDEPKANGAEVHFGVELACSWCPKVFHKVEWNLRMTGPGGDAGRFERVHPEDVGLN